MKISNFEVEIPSPEDSQQNLPTLFIMTGDSVYKFLKDNPTYCLGGYREESGYSMLFEGGAMANVQQLHSLKNSCSKYDIISHGTNFNTKGLCIYTRSQDSVTSLKYSCAFGQKGEALSLESKGGTIPDALLKDCGLCEADVFDVKYVSTLIRNITLINYFL